MSASDTLSERILHRLAQLDQNQREIALASLSLLVLLIIGMAGYRLIEGWQWMDGLYMTFITITTIGFGEVRSLSIAGRFFTIFIGTAGIGIVAFVAARTAQLLLTNQRLRQRQILRKINRMENHYIVCGYGRIGRRVVEDLQRANELFLIIDRQEEEIQYLVDHNFPAIHGDAEDEEVLQQAQIDKAKGLIVALPEDSANVFVTLVAKELNSDLFILARTNDHKNERRLLQAGATKVVAPLDVGADRMSQVVLRPNVDLFMERVLRTSAMGLQMDEVIIQEGSPLAGKSLATSNFRQQFDAIVIGILEAQSQKMKFNPSPHDRIEAGDVLIVLGSDEMISRLRQKGAAAP